MSMLDAHIQGRSFYFTSRRREMHIADSTRTMCLEYLNISILVERLFLVNIHPRYLIQYVRYIFVEGQRNTSNRLCFMNGNDCYFRHN